MSEKVEVRGDVAQLIGGNVHEAPRQNNVVHFNVGIDKGPVQTLTDLQRKRIAGLVRELCAITQEETLDVYRVILTEFGAERMKDMPREKYHEVVAQVERWIVENKESTLKGAQISVPEEPAQTSYTSAPAPCNTCTEKDIGYNRLQRISRGQWVLSTLLSIACALLLYKMPTQIEINASDKECYFEGKPNSVGSSVKVANGITKECARDSKTGDIYWIRTK